MFLVDYFKDIEKKTDRYEIIKLFLELHKKINDFIEKKCSISNESENIYHYTSVKSLKKMINKEERVRFYSVQGMNDPILFFLYFVWLYLRSYFSNDE